MASDFEGAQALQIEMPDLSDILTDAIMNISNGNYDKASKIMNTALVSINKAVTLNETLTASTPAYRRN